MAENKNIKIKDIAQMAGVSVGTVDRVLHDRGRVSEENLKKVKAILEVVNYQPNMMARTLASKKHYKIAVIIPAFQPGEYWEKVYKGIQRAEGEFAGYGVHLEKFLFDQHNSHSLRKIINELLAGSFDFNAVLMATLFSNLMIEFSQTLDLLRIPYNYIDANIPAQQQLAYFGTNSGDSGEIGAKMLLYNIKKNADIVIPKILNIGDQDSNQWINRETGFLDYLNHTAYSGTIHRIELYLDDPVYNFRELDILLKSKPKIRGGIVFNSKAHILANYLKIRNINDISVIGYDVIEANIKLLKEGIIKALIAQRPQQQGYEGIKSLCEYLILKKTPPKENYLPIDILLPENIDYYQNQ
ncbi:substrate-binding domain-containing protein [Microbacter margulisiae]|uniref:LacI family transcriptional regulator n=1 Tax=Microbacter margulisiae TaxID=1350067 RepID=A0A7W5DSV6_9PORP|nr:substrate-binding domain-containing protein [Microbacter margulisiae]MBB3188296.1 LacI family transcriptional regulator [Microbacter margulisiae]